MKLPINYRKAHRAVRRAARLEYVKLQHGSCWYCGDPLNEQPNEEMTKRPINPARFPKGFFDYPVHLHHNHQTDLTIGAVHCYCNATLWQYFGE